MNDRLVCVDGKYIRPSAVVSIEPELFGGCWVYLAIETGGLFSKQHRVIVSMSPDDVARALGHASERIDNPV
ncbi:hypothetical protein KDW82_32625 [Burkholderia vietnamiensis]|uniref:hypothetical protein n=1 Tax=Burkholderia vietnamiensis TaxID=60552 RepID=UPI001B98F245|nr:hypothetical protein [Burkholderia vietnamiensis]MBR8193766.1 hypothetical protein [Burkholderia vietnamiensis]